MRVGPLLSSIFIVGMGLLLAGYSSMSTGAEAGTPPNIQKQENKKMRTIPPVFGQVFEKEGRWGISIDTARPCLPAEMQDFPLDDRKRGLFIAAPAKVVTNGKYVLPLCGGYHLSKKFLNQFRNVYKELTIVVVDAKSHRSFSTNLIDKSLDAEYPDQSISSGTERELEELTVGGYIAINLYHYIPELPKKPAKYLIYALLGDQKSNVVEVEVVDRE